MAREKFHTLTEQMFYVLLCLDEECCGTDILDRVPSMTGGRVTVGSGTLYNLLEQFSEAGMIRETKVEGRRRSYLLTDAGRERLGREYERICAQARDYQEIFGNRKTEREVLDTGWKTWLFMIRQPLKTGRPIWRKKDGWWNSRGRISGNTGGSNQRGWQ